MKRDQPKRVPRPPYVATLFKRARDGQWCWHLKCTRNGKIMAQGESHPTRAKARRAVLAVQLAFTIGVVIETYPPLTRKRRTGWH
jgi:uncharacterized protein YegP (UPF0339 family)